ncbi:hypothetical protein [Yoonia sp. 208BN28-4]|uniref:hypothetical protein n=1 Tax=Yoonia sp. 208BN28-4 TaxID=3126505 RepID=UPI0030EB6CEB
MQEIIHGDARLMLYPDAPDWDGRRTMAIAKLKCDTAADGVAVIEQAATVAKAAGAQGLIGPMEGDTWHSYRLVTEGDGSAPFLMEPTSKPQDLEAFARAGFTPISSYFSAAVALSDIPVTTPGPNDAFSIMAWDGTAPEALFAQVHALSCQAFAGNPFYKDISLPDFLAMYMPFVPMLKPDLILFARDAQGDLKGFLFGMPNYAEGPQPASVILKTYASLTKGAGHALSSRFYDTARAMGFKTAIHALMHDDNLSAIRSGMNNAHVFRRYALMGRSLD